MASYSSVQVAFDPTDILYKLFFVFSIAARRASLLRGNNFTTFAMMTCGLEGVESALMQAMMSPAPNVGLSSF